MANKIAIVTDSTAYIPEALNRQYNIHVVPQVLIWNVCGTVGDNRNFIRHD